MELEESPRFDFPSQPHLSFRKARTLASGESRRLVEKQARFARSIPAGSERFLLA